VCEPLTIDAQWDNPNTDTRRHRPEQAALHRALPPPLQNYLLEKCILEAKNDMDSEKTMVQNYDGKKKEELENNAKSFGVVVKELQLELKKARGAQDSQAQEYQKQFCELQRKAWELEAELAGKTRAMEEYKQELKKFRRVPGIHNFGEVSKDSDSKSGKMIIDKTKCTYSANPDHHYPNHRRGSKRPTQMPNKGSEFDNLGKENGYVYADDKGDLLPVFYYRRR